MKISNYRYPIDNDQFQEIREQGMLYVDKTDMMYYLANRYKYVFLARPRRFGKSLLCNTFKAYFKGQKVLFEGLKVMELEKQWTKYPVFHFILSGLKDCSIPDAKSKLEGFLRNYEKIYGRDVTDETPGARFSGLIHRAYEQTGEKAVVIIDEYDSAIMRLMDKPEELDKMRSLFREFYQVLKDEGEYLRFVFITGVTKFSQLSIFSELNNLKQISMLDEYSGICGITQEELDTILLPCVEEYAEGLEITTEEAYALMKKNYDGYHFSKKSKDVYAPFSLLRALDDKTSDPYWFDSGTSKSLIDHLQHYPEFNPLDFDGVELSINAFNVPCENASTPIPLLYQSGYLTIASYDKELDSYKLHFPNQEVRRGMIESLTNYLMDAEDLERDAAVLTMASALKKGDLLTALTGLRSWIAGLPYDIVTKKEWMAKKTREAFYKLILYAVFSLLNCKVDTEVKSVLGRADVVIKTKTDIFVLELKVDETVENALAQIEDKGYAIAYEADGRKVTKCGVCIASEQRNISHCRITDDKGNILEDKDFLNK